RTPDMHFYLWVVEGCKKPQALEVVHVQMREQDVHAAERPGEYGAESADAGPRVEDEHRAVSAAHFHTRRIPTIACCLRPWCCYGPARPPERDVHHPATSQKMAMAPR